MRFTAWTLVLAIFLAPLVGLAREAEVFEAPKQIVVTFTGDCTLGNDMPMRGNAKSFEAYINQYGYEYPFAEMKEIFEADDLTVINLEGVFKDDDSFVQQKEHSVYHFRGPTDFAQILPLGGIDAVSIANNHMIDYGRQGQESTIDALESVNIPWFGTNEFVDQTWIYEKDGVKIGFVAAYISDWQNVNLNLKPVLEQDVHNLRSAGCAVIIACIHAGAEYYTFFDEGSYQEWMANAFIRYGVDIVVGNHPHTIQGLRVQDGVTTLWSLGNFCFGGNPEIRSNKMNESVISTYLAQFTFSFDEDGVYLGHQLNIIPCHNSGTREYNDYQPHPVSGRDAEVVLKALQRDVRPRGLKLNPYVEGVGAVQEFVPAPIR